MAKEMAMKSHCNDGKSGLQLKAMSDVTKAVSEKNDVANKKENAGSTEESREAEAARVVEQGDNDYEISSGDQVKKGHDSKTEPMVPPTVMTILQEPTATDEIAVGAKNKASKDCEAVRPKRETSNASPGEQEEEDTESLTESEMQLAGRDEWDGRFEGSEEGGGEQEEDDWGSMSG